MEELAAETHVVADLAYIHVQAKNYSVLPFLFLTYNLFITCEHESALA